MSGVSAISALTLPSAHRNEICLPEIWEQMMGRSIDDYDNRSQQMLGRAIRKVPGWHFSGQPRTKKYGKQRVYSRNGSLPS